MVTKIIRINNNGGATDVPVTLFTLSYADSFLQSITDVAGRKTSFGYTSIGGYKQLTAVTFPDGQKAMYSYDNAGSMLKAYDEEAKGGVGFAYAKFNGTVCVQKVREFAATSLTAAETVGQPVAPVGIRSQDERVPLLRPGSNIRHCRRHRGPVYLRPHRQNGQHCQLQHRPLPNSGGYPPPPTPQTPRPRRKTASPVRRLPAIWPKTS